MIYFSIYQIYNNCYNLARVWAACDRLKPVRNDFQSVYFFKERRAGTFYKLEPWNKRKYVWPSRLMRIDGFDSVLSASFVAILLSPNFARRRASNAPVNIIPCPPPRPGTSGGFAAFCLHYW